MSDHEEERLLEHEYDGIREYDNPLPRWWTAIFWATFLFAFGYFFHYHLSGKGDSIAAEYQTELVEAREALAKREMGEKPSEEGLANLLDNPTMVDDGKALYSERCAVCHADQGQGLIGPNLTDDYWIHGKGTLLEIYDVVEKGVPQKGMPAWAKQLSPIELAKVSAYVGSIRDKHLPGKAPQGTKLSTR
jgi:cytochrome c oxidase cbb3-type subunit III